MPSPFAITAATNTVSLDNNRQGQASFIVSNTMSHNIRGRARVVALSTTAEPWLKLAGEAERDFVNAGSQQYIVQISLPQDAPAGDDSFRLDVVDVANPDDNFTRGPTVKFVVPTPLPAPKKPFAWWIVALVVLILLGGTTGIFQVMHNATVTKAHVDATATAVAQVTATATVQSAHATATAQAQATALAHYAQYTGTWINDDPNTRNIPQIVITNNGPILTFHGYGSCSPTYCDWGTVTQNFAEAPMTVIFTFDGSRSGACCTGAGNEVLTITFYSGDNNRLSVANVYGANILHRK